MLKQGVFKIKKNFIDDIWTVTKSQEVASFNHPFKRPRNQPCIWLPKINRYCPYFNSTVLLISMLLKLDPYILLKVIFLLQVGRSSTINPKVKVMNIIFHWLSIFQQFPLNNTVSCSGRAGWCSSFYGRWESESITVLFILSNLFNSIVSFTGWESIAGNRYTTGIIEILLLHLTPINPISIYLPLCVVFCHLLIILNLIGRIHYCSPYRAHWGCCPSCGQTIWPS
jgi:hypothetical protein